MALGSFVLVLHGHLPYVLRHGVWPHGEDWLYEAAAETYLPLLNLFHECTFLNSPPRVTLGLTPVLLEQLAHDDFKAGFAAYLVDRRDRCVSDAKAFSADHQPALVKTANWWADEFAKLIETFDRIDRDIPKAFAGTMSAGVQLLTSNATHGYMPLLLEDSSLRAQMRAGVATSERILGVKPRGMWLPECAYRPAGFWEPAVAWGESRHRAGVERAIEAAGVAHFFVENRLIQQSTSRWVHNEGWHRVDPDEARKYPSRGWRSVHQPMRVDGGDTQHDASIKAPSNVSVFARDTDLCERVWSAEAGYPGHPDYLEFHRKQGRRGLRYWRITGRTVGAGDKQAYDPDVIAGRVFEHARHFCDSVKDRLRKFRDETGQAGVVAACFDAELFGHWWFEGPEFLRDVILTLNADPDITLSTAEDHLDNHPPDKAVTLPEGSWGEGSDHRVWMNDKLKWMWEIIYRAETTFGRLTFNLPWRTRNDLREVLEIAGRELLLLQASDWPFVVSREQAVDYGIKRFMLHATRFERACDIAERLSALAATTDWRASLTEIEQAQLQEAEAHDVIFADIDLTWWDD